MTNPYKSSAHTPRPKVHAPTLDLDPTTGPEMKRPLPVAPDSGETVPHGTIKEILDWVGDSVARARAAIAAEKARGDEERTTLVYRLQRIGAK